MSTFRRSSWICGHGRNLGMIRPTVTKIAIHNSTACSSQQAASNKACSQPAIIALKKKKAAPNAVAAEQKQTFKRCHTSTHVPTFLVNMSASSCSLLISAVAPGFDGRTLNLFSSNSSSFNLAFWSLSFAIAALRACKPIFQSLLCSKVSILCSWPTAHLCFSTTDLCDRVSDKLLVLFRVRVPSFCVALDMATRRSR